MASQILEQDNIFRALFSTMRTATAASTMKRDLAAFQVELRKIDNSIDAGQVEELHKEYKKIAEKIGDFDDRQYQIAIWTLTMENELLELILQAVADLKKAKSVGEDPGQVKKDVETIIGPFSKLKEDIATLMEVVSDIEKKIKSLEAQLKKV